MDLVPTVMLTFRPEFVPLLRGNQTHIAYSGNTPSFDAARAIDCSRILVVLV
jgi:hypothetical protein